MNFEEIYKKSNSIEDDFGKISYKISSFISNIEKAFDISNYLKESTTNGKLFYIEAEKDLVFINMTSNGIINKIKDGEKPNLKTISILFDIINKHKTPQILEYQKIVLDNEEFDNDDKENMIKIIHEYMNTKSKINMVLYNMSKRWKEFENLKLV